MSEQQPTNTKTNDNNDKTKSFGEGLLKVLVIGLGAIALIMTPAAFYIIALIFGQHLAFGDLSNGIGSSALAQIAYNATHVQQYQQLAQVLTGYSISMANTDTTLSIFGLFLGLVVDSVLAVLIYREYKNL